MKIGIIGAGFTGLAAAYYLTKKGHNVTIIERDKIPGGLAVGFEDDKWSWSLEKHYHHFFTNDYSILNLAKEIDFPIITKRPKTSVFIDTKIYQLDSPTKVLTFKKLNIFERIRMAGALAFLRYNPFWKTLEKYEAEKILPHLMGKRAYDLIWSPQLFGKFGDYSQKISLAWFWARVKKRTTNLSYPKGGFLRLALEIEKKIKQQGGIFLYETEVEEIKDTLQNPTVKIKGVKISKSLEFDKVIVTLPGALFKKIAPSLPASYVKSLDALKGIGAINIVLRLKNKFFNDNTYWLSICDTSFPFLAVVEHTNLMNKKNYNGQHLVYVGKYADFKHPYFSLTDKELFNTYEPFLKKINPNFKKDLIKYDVFRAPFAQPIIPTNYSKIIPPFETPLKNVYLANIQQVYPWDRGTNYAVEMGKKIVDKIS